MAELRDPELPAGAVVEVDEETGEGIRNDGKRLKPASQNPWYVLMTIAGEQDEDWIDWNLHKKKPAVLERLGLLGNVGGGARGRGRTDGAFAAGVGSLERSRAHRGRSGVQGPVTAFGD